jgi:hypothetical protein
MVQVLLLVSVSAIFAVGSDEKLVRAILGIRFGKLATMVFSDVEFAVVRERQRCFLKQWTNAHVNGSL